MRRLGTSFALLVLLWPMGIALPDPDLGVGSRFMGGPPPLGADDTRPFAWDRPEGNAVIIYLTGSTAEPKPDACDTSRPGGNVPETITDLAAQTLSGVRLSVFAFCTPTKVGGWNQPGGDKIPKVISRAWELQDLLLFAERQGIPRNRIFVAGQSAGGWAGLLVQRWGQAQMGGLIAFAPAFAGRDGRRPKVWQEERDRQVLEISSASALNALVFGFERNPYEAPKAMTWLASRADVDYVALSSERIAGMACEHRDPHTTVFRDCFRETQQQWILSYIAEQLAGRD